MAESVANPLTIRAVYSITEIPAHVWDGFSGTENPFLRHSFFLALEDSGCTVTETGWTPSHLVFYRGEKMIGVAPAFLKSHSRGEYVFDWAWADAYQRYGFEYYPKLLIAVPFTPSVGARLFLGKDERDRITPNELNKALDGVAADNGVSSWHLLFPDQADQNLLDGPGRMHRLGCQFHWFNHDYEDFEAFLATLTSRKRKSIRKERRDVAAQDIEFHHFPGVGLPGHVLSAFYVFYQATYLKRGQRPYLNLEFFQALQQHQPDQLHIIMAIKDNQMIAGALFLTGANTLYGRYWGCLEEYNHLHFETCYYQGIELAIARGLRCFDAGAQGEHKLVRGFEPVLTHSWHWVANPAFADAIDQFTREEAREVEAYRRAAQAALPYRQTEEP